MSEALERNAKGLSIILDPLKFRRASLASALGQWAREKSIQIEQKSFEEAQTGFDAAPLANLRLVIVNLGGTSITEDNSLAAIRKLRELTPEARIVIISDREDGAEIVAAFKSGAHGYIPTSTDPSVALQALSFVLAGGSFFPPTVLLAKGRNASPNDHADPNDASFATNGTKTFTPSQLRVMAQLREGKSNKLIARDLRLCEATVKLHVRQIMRKLGASNRTQVAIYCSTDVAVEDILRNGEAVSVADASVKDAIQLPNGRSDGDAG